MPDDRTPTGEDLIHGQPPEKSIPVATEERDHAQDRAAAAEGLADELRGRPAIPAPSAPATQSATLRDAATGATLDGRS